jgi:hypothetical protein
MMLYTRNYGMPVLDPLSLFPVKGREFITSLKVTWNRYKLNAHPMHDLIVG